MSTRASSAPADLVADIGGTNARFARAAADCRPFDERTLPVAEFASIVDAVEHYLADTGGERPWRAGFAVATPIIGDHIKLTNGRWDFSIEQTRAALRLHELRLLNDFTALAWSLPLLDPRDMHPVGGGAAVADAPRALIGPGTGLGTSGLLSSPGGFVPVEGEGGHASFSPADEREAAILAVARRAYSHVSVERLVSGTGLPLLLSAVAEVDRLPMPARWPHSSDGEAAVAGAGPSPPSIIEAALADADPLCVATLNTFCAMLGTAAGNLALTLGARGGVYIGGGIVPRLGEFFDRSPFRQRFESKGRFSAYLAAIPTFVIEASNPALAGVARALAEPKRQ
jgi:glucokinase